MMMLMSLRAGGHHHRARVLYRSLRWLLIRMLMMLTVMCVAGTRTITLEGLIWAKIFLLAGEIYLDVAGERARENADDLL